MARVGVLHYVKNLFSNSTFLINKKISHKYTVYYFKDQVLIRSNNIRYSIRRMGYSYGTRDCYIFTSDNITFGAYYQENRIYLNSTSIYMGFISLPKGLVSYSIDGKQVMFRNQTETKPIDFEYEPNLFMILGTAIALY